MPNSELLKTILLREDIKMKEQNFVYFRDLRNGTTQLKFSEFAVTSFYNDVIMQLKSGKVFRAIKYGILFPVHVFLAYIKMKKIITNYNIPK